MPSQPGRDERPARLPTIKLLHRDNPQFRPMKTFADFLAAAKIENSAGIEKFDTEARRTLDEQLRLGSIAGPLTCNTSKDPDATFKPLPGQPFSWGKLNPVRDVHPIISDQVLTSFGSVPYGRLSPENSPEQFKKNRWCRTTLSLSPASPYIFAETLFDGIQVTIKVLKAADSIATWPDTTHADLPKSGDPQERAINACLDESYPLIAIKGPPGTGKTDLLAEVTLKLAEAGKKVGIVSVSHSAVDNALARIMNIRGGKQTVTVWKHADPELVNSTEVPEKDSTPRPETRKMKETDDTPSIWGAVIASAIHMFRKENKQLVLDFKFGTCDVLLIDEAGQVPAYDAAALSHLAPRMILFGDEDQLPHIAHGHHPPGSHGDSSAMGYLRAILPGHSIALQVSHRMNSAICGLIQRHFYPDVPGLTAGKNANAHLMEGSSRFPALIKDDFPHKHPRLSRSEEEAARVVKWVQRLLKMQAVVEGNEACPMATEDIAILTPFRAHAAAIKSALEKAGIPNLEKLRLGTVDKMQGEGASAVIYSLASSSKDYIAAQTEWLLSSNRWNVALSRAIACAIVVGDMEAHLTAVPKALDGIAAQAMIRGVMEDVAWETCRVE